MPNDAARSTHGHAISPAIEKNLTFFDDQPVPTEGKNDKNEGSKYGAEPGRKKEWKSNWIQRRTLLIYIFVLLLCIVALAALFAESQIHHGLSTSNNHAYYVFKYSPMTGT